MNSSADTIPTTSPTASFAAITRSRLGVMMNVWFAVPWRYSFVASSAPSVKMRTVGSGVPISSVAGLRGLEVLDVGEAGQQAGGKPLDEQHRAEQQPRRRHRDELEPLRPQDPHRTLPLSPVSSRKRSSSVRDRAGELEHRDAVLGGDRADLLERDAVEEHRVGAALAARGWRPRPRAAAQLAHPRRAHERGPRVARDEVLERALHDEPPDADDDDAVDRLLDLRQDVAGDQHRAPLGGERDEDVAQPAHALRVQAVGGLVEHEDLRVAEQRGRQREALAHAHRVALHAAVARRRELGHVEHLVDAAVRQAGGGGERAQVAAPGAARDARRAASSDAPTVRTGSLQLVKRLAHARARARSSAG